MLRVSSLVDMEFKQTVIEALRDNKIFYIGKGYGNRVFQHAMNALDGDISNLKLETIRAVIKPISLSSITLFDTD